MSDDREIFVVTRAFDHPSVRDTTEVAGVIHDSFEVADALLALMNDAEELVTGTRPFRRGWGQDLITLKNWKAWVTQ